MRNAMLAALVLGACVTMTGCFTFDAQHNRDQWYIIKTDLGMIHSDVDFLLALEEPTHLDSGKYR